MDSKLLVVGMVVAVLVGLAAGVFIIAPIVTTNSTPSVSGMTVKEAYFWPVLASSLQVVSLNSTSKVNGDSGIVGFLVSAKNTYLLDGGVFEIAMSGNVEQPYYVPLPSYYVQASQDISLPNYQTLYANNIASVQTLWSVTLGCQPTTVTAYYLSQGNVFTKQELASVTLTNSTC